MCVAFMWRSDCIIRMRLCTCASLHVCVSEMHFMAITGNAIAIRVLNFNSTVSCQMNRMYKKQQQQQINKKVCFQ